MEYHILFTDLDGTLLASRSEMLEANKQAVAAAYAVGKPVVISSGRNWVSLARYEELLGTHRPGTYGVAFNGGAVYRTVSAADGTLQKELLHTTLLPHADAQDLYTLVQPLAARTGGAVTPLVYNHQGLLFAEEHTRQAPVYTAAYRHMAVNFIPAFAGLPGDIFKMVLHGPMEHLHQIVADLSPHIGERCYALFTARDLLEVGPLAADKGRAVHFLAQHLGVPVAATIAMGDEANDIPMLREAGLGIAVANASSAAKEAADLVLPETNNDAAVAAVINRYLLP